MKIAIIDSGIHPGHPHVGPVAGGVSFTNDGDWLDRLGHGTAVAGAIREKVPHAELFAVKVFERRLSAGIETLLRALAWSIEQAMDVINLSLGTTNPAHRELFGRAAANGLVVGPAGGLPVTIAVEADPACPRESYRWNGEVFLASPYPRSIPGVPRERNLHGVSFAVANMTGFVACALVSTPREAIRAELIRRAGGSP